MIKTKTRSKKAMVKIEAAVPEVVAPVMVRRESRQPSGIVLEIVSPAAKQVLVAGSFNQWNPERTPLVAASDGRWTGHLNLGPGRHEYLFVVDGQWLPDPNARESVANPFGGRNSVLKVAE